MLHILCAYFITCGIAYVTMAVKPIHKIYTYTLIYKLFWTLLNKKAD